MAKLIVKSPYIKSGGKKTAAGYVSYIGTRENVEIIPDDRPATPKQQQLIRKLVRDFPDTKTLLEYSDYENAPTKFHASSFITLALEANWDAVQNSEVYMKYIATRPRVERFGAHGLFGEQEHVSLDEAVDEMERYEGNVWTHIISLKREDAARLGYDNALSWRNLICAHRNDIAAAMKIHPSNFRWCAAYHDEGEHPHIHLMAWSTESKEAYLSKDGIRQIKSKLTNTIFRDELHSLYEQKSESRDELVREARQELLKLASIMRDGICDHPEAEQLMRELAGQLSSVKGKKSYGYLPKKQKELVDRIVDQMERLPVVSQCYDRWLELQGKVDSYYHDKSQVRISLSAQKEFRHVKNAVIHEAVRLASGEPTFEDGDINEKDEPEQFKNSTPHFDYLWDQIRDESLSSEERTFAITEVEQLAHLGDAYAQYLLGVLYRDGPLLIPNASKAVQWLEKAASDNHLAAQYALGKLYLSSDSEVRNVQKGLKWLKTASDNGSDYAAYLLGKTFLTGKQVKKSVDAAVSYFKKAAEQGNQYAQYMLGKMLMTGKEIPFDKEEAVRWLSMSVAQGNRYAEYFINHKDEYRHPPTMLSVTKLLHHMSRIFRDNSTPKSRPGGIQIDRKRLKRLQEKRMAMGHKRDDHEEQTNYQQTM